MEREAGRVSGKVPVDILYLYVQNIGVLQVNG